MVEISFINKGSYSYDCDQNDVEEALDCFQGVLPSKFIELSHDTDHILINMDEVIAIIAKPIEGKEVDNAT